MTVLPHPPGPGGAIAPGEVLIAAGDNQVRWSAGERFHHLFEAHCDGLSPAHRNDPVVDTGERRVSAPELDRQANRLANFLAEGPLRPGDVVGLLLEDPIHTYAAVLAVSKLGGVFVPLDPDWPDERLAYVLADAGAVAVISHGELGDRARRAGPRTICLDRLAAPIAAAPAGRIDRGGVGDEICYLIYTSGTTGRPKGVAVAHSSICNFVRVAVGCYGYRRTDRVYQGLNVAFDFSTEEIWVPLLAGATLVPRPSGERLAGAELAEFLRSRRVTAVCAVPTLWTTVTGDLPDLRLLIMSGEACPPDLVRRWSAPKRRMLNLYGPTEATVSASWCELRPDEPVTIGVPLPTYSLVILDPAGNRPLPAGEVGEIGIGGIGVALGYHNAPAQTDRVFVPDEIGLPNNPGGRLYRTGDLGRVGPDGSVEYLGRVDSQVKIRGYRIDPGEIEAALREFDGVREAAVRVHGTGPETALAAYYTSSQPLEQADVHAHLAATLPRYMLPTHVARIDRIPMLPSGKVDRTRLPEPIGPRFVARATAPVGPDTPTESLLTRLAREALGVAEISVVDDVFDVLGANSLTVARWCAAVRAETGGSAPATRDVYRLRTVRAIAELLDRPETTVSAEAIAPTAPAVSDTRYRLCGLAQALILGAAALALATVFGTAAAWCLRADGPDNFLGRAMLAALAVYALACAVPIGLKWALVGVWRDGTVVPLWGPRYLRYWTAKMALGAHPWAFAPGTPLPALLLRCLGARVGTGVVLLSGELPVCPDVLTIGDHAVVHQMASIRCARAERDGIHVGAVSIGADAGVGAASVLDIGTEIGPGATLAHASSLHEGQVIPPGESWHGSPAEPAPIPTQRAAAAPDATEIRVGAGHPAERARARRRERGATAAALLAQVAVVWAGLVASFGSMYAVGRLTGELGGPARVGLALAVPTVLLTAGVVGGLALVVGGTRLLSRAVATDWWAPVNGWRWLLVRTIQRLSTIPFFMLLFGDSSFVVGYLSALGYRLSPVVQTGSNFGVVVGHDVPRLCGVGSGSMVSDGLLFTNIEVRGGQFRVRRAQVGRENFLGNEVVIPPDSMAGDDCLLATKVMVPTDGGVRTGVGLLGSPAFEIPRHTARDDALRESLTASDVAAALVAKNRYNLVTIAVFLCMWWAELALAYGDAIGLNAGTRPSTGVVEIVIFTAAPAMLGLRVAVERFFARRPIPEMCSIYDRRFWQHERYWKVMAYRLLTPLDGTPMRSVLMRALGVRVGRRLLDEGSGITERKLVTIGDDCVLNAKADLQSHSLEDGVFKTGPITIGSGVTVGLHALVHYSTELGEGSRVAPDSFLMKGEQPAANSYWTGNPARPVRARAPRRLPD